MTITKIAVVGAAGHMGRQVLEAIASDPDSVVAAAIDREEAGPLDHLAGLASKALLTYDLKQGLKDCDVVIDFSSPSGFDSLIEVLDKDPIPAVSGTTGIEVEQLQRFYELSSRVPVFYSPNMSVGIQVLLELIERAVQSLGPTYDVEIVETHHRRKLDAPSGTAKRLHRAVAETGQQAFPDLSREIPVHAIRGGDVVGDHSVFFMGDGDRIELTHRATARSTFAVGALRAAKWLVTQPPAAYTMKDLLGA